jgi:hypothetical protein
LTLRCSANSDGLAAIVVAVPPALPIEPIAAVIAVDRSVASTAVTFGTTPAGSVGSEP